MVYPTYDYIFDTSDRSGAFSIRNDVRFDEEPGCIVNSGVRTLEETALSAIRFAARYGYRLDYNDRSAFEGLVRVIFRCDEDDDYIGSNNMMYLAENGLMDWLNENVALNGGEFVWSNGDLYYLSNW